MIVRASEAFPVRAMKFTVLADAGSSAVPLNSATKFVAVGDELEISVRDDENAARVSGEALSKFTPS